MNNKEHIINYKGWEIYFSHEQFLMLTERQQRVLELRFGLNDNKIFTLEEVGVQIGSVRNKDIPINRERVRQIEARAIRLLFNKKRHIKIVNTNDHSILRSGCA